MLNSVQRALGYREIYYNIKNDKFWAESNGDRYEQVDVVVVVPGGSLDNVSIISETEPLTRSDSSPLLEGDSWYTPSTDQLSLYISGVWDEIKVDEGASGGVASGFWKFKDLETQGWDDGKFRVNSHQNKTDWSLTTEVYIAYLTNDGANTKNILLNLVKPGQYIYIQRKDVADAWVILQVSSVPTDDDVKGCTVPVSFVSQGTAVSDLTNDKLCDVSFMVVAGGGGSASASNFTFDASIIPDTNSAYDLGSAEYKVRHLYLSNNSIKFEGGDLGVTGADLTFQGEPMQVGTLAAVLTSLGVLSFGDNGAALGGGLLVGEVYYNTTRGKLASVTS